MKRPRIEWETKVAAGRIYVTHEDDFDASMQANIDGDEAQIHTLNGRAFFRCCRFLYKDAFPPGVKYLNFLMNELRLLKFMALMDDVYYFEHRGTVVKKRHDGADRVFFKVRVSLR